MPVIWDSDDSRATNSGLFFIYEHTDETKLLISLGPNCSHLFYSIILSYWCFHTSNHYAPSTSLLTDPFFPPHNPHRHVGSYKTSTRSSSSPNRTSWQQWTASRMPSSTITSFPSRWKQPWPSPPSSPHRTELRRLWSQMWVCAGENKGGRVNVLFFSAFYHCFFIYSKTSISHN